MSTAITLLTDFGLSDSYVAEVKAVLLRDAPGVPIVDVSHDIPRGDVRAAQYLLGRTWHRFPEGTVHVVVVDPGVGTDRRALAAARGGHGFVAPDNGVLGPVLTGARIVALEIPPAAAPTFHGRDVFAPAAARLARGEALERVGLRVTDPVTGPLPEPTTSPDGAVGEVVYVDRFGTLVTNIGAALVAGAVEAILPEGRRARFGHTFGDVVPGALVAFVGSGGTVEVAVRDGSAATLTGTGVGAVVRVARAP